MYSSTGTIACTHKHTCTHALSHTLHKHTHYIHTHGNTLRTSEVETTSHIHTHTHKHTHTPVLLIK